MAMRPLFAYLLIVCLLQVSVGSVADTADIGAPTGSSAQISALALEPVDDAPDAFGGQQGIDHCHHCCFSHLTAPASVTLPPATFAGEPYRASSISPVIVPKAPPRRPPKA